MIKQFSDIVNIQLVHNFKVNIRICQPRTALDVHRGEAEYFDTVILFLILYQVFSYIINLLRCTENKIISTIAFQVSERHMRCVKECIFF